VVENQHFPRFHIHNQYTRIEDGVVHTYTFKHWVLESGNLTSSLTILSNMVLVAAYDETMDNSQPDSTLQEIG